MLMVIMTEDDTSNTMKEFGPELGIDTSISNDFGDFAPPKYERGQGGQPRSSEHNERFVTPDMMNMLANALILVNKDRDELTPDELSWIENNKSDISAAVQSGNFDERFAKKLGIDTETATNTPATAQVIEADDRWKDFGGTDWDNIQPAVTEATPPAHLSEDQKNNWYRELASDWQNRPQTRKYWEDRRDVLINEAGMTNDEVNDLVRNHTVREAVRPEDIEEVNVGKAAAPENRIRAQRQQIENPDDRVDNLNNGRRQDRERSFFTRESELLPLIDNKEAEDQYKLVDIILTDLETRYRSTLIDQLPKDFQERVLEIEGWATDYSIGKEQPLKPEVAEVVLARIRTDQTYKVIASLNLRSPGYRDQAQTNLDRLYNDGRLLTPADIDIVMGIKDNDLGIPYYDAYISHQMASAVGVSVDGVEKPIKWAASGISRTDRVRVESVLRSKHDAVEDKKKVENAVLVASRIHKILGESSVMNLRKDEPLAQATYLREARRDLKDKQESGLKGDDYGPEGNIETIPTIATSAIRMAIDGDKKHVFQSQAYAEAIALGKAGKPKEALETLLPIYRLDPENTGIDSNNTFLDPKTIDLSKVSEDFLRGYYTNYIPNVLETRKLLLKSTWDPKELTSDKIGDIVNMFNNVDPTAKDVPMGVLRLPRQFIRGMFSEVFKRGATPTSALAEGWSNRAAVDDILDRFVSLRLISHDELKKILKEYPIDNLAIRLKAQRKLGWD